MVRTRRATTTFISSRSRGLLTFAATIRNAAQPCHGPFRRGTSPCMACGPALGRKALPAVVAALVQDLAAADSAHTGAETVTALAHQSAWLECTFHRRIFLLLPTRAVSIRGWLIRLSVAFCQTLERFPSNLSHQIDRKTHKTPTSPFLVSDQKPH